MFSKDERLKGPIQPMRTLRALFIVESQTERDLDHDRHVPGRVLRGVEREGDGVVEAAAVGPGDDAGGGGGEVGGEQVPAGPSARDLGGGLSNG